MRGCFSIKLSLAFLALAIAGCASTAAPVNPFGSAFTHSTQSNASSGSPIKHIVFIVQENRSLDNIFAGYPGADAPTYGYEHDGTKVTLQPIDFKGPDLAHGFKNSLTDYDGGKMDGFDLTSPYNPLYPYHFLNRKLVAPYWAMAHQYVLADHMFPTEHGASWTSHLDLITGTTLLSSSLAEADYPSNKPWGCDAPASTTTDTIDTKLKVHTNGPFPCFTLWETMADTLDAAQVSWKYYAPQVVGCKKVCNGGGLIWNTYDAIKKVRYGSDWTNNVISPQTQVLSDITSGKLAAVSYVMPDWQDSDHPGSQSDRGPSWVAAVVNAIGGSKYWKSTAIVVLWDDWGGWYDDVPPPQLDWLGLAIRVPCIMISAYPKGVGYVSHTQYEFGSVLKFMEETFGLASLGTTDKRAASISDSFDFTKKPIAFKKIPAKYPPPMFLHEQPTINPPDHD